MYEKQTWVNGEVITEEKLNHMEDGIANAGFLIVDIIEDPDNDTYYLNKSWNEIYNAPIAVAINAIEGTQKTVGIVTLSTEMNADKKSYTANAFGEIYTSESPDDFLYVSGGR